MTVSFLPVVLFLLVLAHALQPSRHFERQNVPAIRSIPQSAWDSLKSSVGGRLYDARPKNLPCYRTYGNGQSTSSNSVQVGKCNEIQSNRNNPEYIANTFGGYQISNFGTCMASGQSCSMSNSGLDLTSGFGTCYQGSVPEKYIDVREVADIQKGLSFAAQNKIPLVIKNTGHDYKGRSSGQYSLALWTHNFKSNLRFDERFTPEGCGASAGPAVTFGAGEQFGAINAFAHDKGYSLVTGAASTVGASGGWITGGGHSALSTTLGLGVDNALEMKVVLPNGTYITANRCKNQDIFFALRGGGGGTFGVVVSTSSKLIKEFPLQLVNIAFNQNGQSEFNRIAIDNAEKWAQDGWGGYVVQNGNQKIFTAVTPKLKNTDEARASMKPLLDYAASSLSIYTVSSLDSFYDYFDGAGPGLLNNFGNGLSIAMSSRLVTRDVFQNADSKAKLRQFLDSQTTSIQFVTPSLYNLPDSDKANGPGEASISPAWRNSLWHVILQRDWDGGSKSDSTVGAVSSRFKTVRDLIQPLRDLTPSGGAYLNEADTFEPNYAQSFWGQKNYDRLLKIKKQIDPDNILTCHQCIGWNPNDPRFGCYPKF